MSSKLDDLPTGALEMRPVENFDCVLSGVEEWARTEPLILLPEVAVQLHREPKRKDRKRRAVSVEV